MKRNRRTYIIAVCAFFLALFAGTAFLTRALYEKQYVRSAGDVYSTISLPASDEVLSIINRDGFRLCRFDDRGRLAGSCELPETAEESGENVYVNLLNADADTVYFSYLYAQTGLVKGADFYELDLGTWTFRHCFSLSDYIDMQKEVLYADGAVSYVGSSRGDFGLCLLTEGEDTDSVYRLLHFAKGENGGYKLRERTISGAFWKTGFTKQAGTVLIDMEGNVYAPERSDEPFFLDDGSLCGTHNTNYEIYEDGVHFYNLDAGKSFFVPFAAPDQIKVSEAADEETIDTGLHIHQGMELQSTLRDENGALTAEVLRDGEAVWIYERADGSYYELSRYVTADSMTRALWIGALILMGIAEAAGAYMLYRFWERNGVRVPVFVKILIVLIGMIAVMYTAISSMMGALLRSNRRSFALSYAYQFAEETILDLDTERLARYAEGELSLTKETYYEFLQTGGNGSNAAADAEDAELVSVENLWSDLYPLECLYLYRDGGIYLLNSPGLIDVEAEYNGMSSELLQLIREAIANGRPEQKLLSDGYIHAVVPIVADDGKTIGAADGMAYYQYLAYLVQDETRWAVMQLTLLLAGISAVLLVWLYGSLKPLGRLKRAVEALADGKTEVRVPERGIDEIAEIGATFNAMAEHIGKDRRVQEEYREQYTRFIPEEILRALEQRDILQIKRGDYACFDAAQLKLGCVNFEDVCGLEPDAVFRFINAYLPVQIDIAAECGGVVDTMEREGICAYFREQPSEALRAALLATSFLNRAGGTAGGGALFTAAISYGSEAIGIVGNDARLSVENVSRERMFAEQIWAHGKRLGAEVVVTGCFLKQLRDPYKAYAIRRLGTFEIGTVQEELYEVFDGGAPEQKRLKQETLLQYEAGLDAYDAGDLRAAHNAFAEVLRRNPSDLAAKHYFYLCDRE